MMNKPNEKPASVAQRSKQFYDFVETMAAHKLTHTELWNIAFGIGARFSQLFPDRTERETYHESDWAKKVDKLLASAPRPDVDETNSGKLLLRLPKSLHAALVDEARKEGTSMNQLILAKLAVSLSQAVAH